ncbi:hypothetical protein H9Q69_012859 [Fusarium xylarioides]|nr:hypothetical protein H9Q69_012859 [Fusarium xylarioides]
MSAQTSTGANSTNGSTASPKGQPNASKLKFDLTTALKDVPKPGSTELLFRPDRNAKRLVMSAQRVSLPGFDPEQLVELIKALVRVDAKKWLPEPGSFRAWPGGFGYAKVGANYGPSFASHCEAQQAGYDQVLWLLGEEGQVTGAGASNFFAVVRDEKTSKPVLLTAPLTDRVILDGVTRRSVLDLVESRLSEELEVREAKFTIKDIEAAWRNGLLQEAFVSGTAFFIKNVSTIRVGDFNIDLPQKQDDGSAFGPRIKSWLKDIMFGGEDHEWGVVVE